MNDREKEFIEAHCRDFGKYPLVITKDMGLNVVVPDRPDLKPTAPSRFDVKLRITSYMGISIGAMHFFGTLEYSGPYLSDGESWHGGYISEGWSKMSRDIKDLFGLLRIEVLRPVTSFDLISDPIRWEGYDEGDPTNSFVTKESLLTVATQIVKLRFPEFKMIINDLT